MSALKRLVASEVTAAVRAAAKAALNELYPKGLGAEKSLVIEGKAYVARIERHYHEPGGPLKPWGNHLGISMFKVVEDDQIMASTLSIQDRALSISATEGIKHLELADWTTSTRPSEEFLAVLALRLLLAGYLIGNVTKDTSADGTTTIRVELDARDADPERVEAAKMLVAPLGVYADMAGLKFTAKAPDTGAIPIPVLITGGAVAVTVVIAQAYVVMYVAEKAGSIVDAALKRNAASSEIQRADAEVLKLVNNHVQREQTSGKTLPLDEATRAALAGLQTRVGSLVKSAFESEASKGFPSWALPTIGLAAVAAVTAIIVYRVKKGNKQHG